jgi:hypothetical protein
MKIEKIYTGSWFPRTKLHLKEFFNFLKYQSSELGFEKQKLIKLFSSLAVKNVQYQGGIFDKISVQCQGVNFEYFEDGLLIIEKKFEKIEEDLKFLENFYQHKLVSVFTYFDF